MIYGSGFRRVGRARVNIKGKQLSRPASMSRADGSVGGPRGGRGSIGSREASVPRWPTEAEGAATGRAAAGGGQLARELL